MRNSTSGTTPKANTVQDESNNVSNNAEKTSAKKLKQARLPFKVIAPGTSPLGSKAASTTTPAIQEKDKDATKIVNNSTDSRKRKLSYDEAEDDESVNVVTGDDDDDNVSKENVEILTAVSKKKKLSAIENNTTEVVSLLDDDDDCDDDDHENKINLDESHKEVANSSVVSIGGKRESCLKTPKSNAKDNKQCKGAGTPSNTSSSQKDKNSGSASKLQIKLPLSAGKKKRRKSKLHQLSLNNSTAGAEGSHHNSAQELSSDDIEEIAVELNPLKRKKLNTTDDDGEFNKTVETKSADQAKREPIETIALDSESDKEEENGNKAKINKKEKATDVKTSKKNSEQIIKDDIKSKENTSPKSKTKSTEKPKSSEDDDDLVEDVENVSVSKSSEENENNGKHVEDDDKEELDESVLTDHDHDNEADDETEKETSKIANISSDISESSKTSKPNTTKETQKNDKNTNSSTLLSSSASSKSLTPKQMKLMEQRRKAREEKERKLQEEKLKKQQEKEEKELARKREREEKEEQKRKEREEKEEQKRKEREEKERKRLAEVEAKNEEKRKKNEAKEEELRKKEEERKRKEQEKEEAELKKKKAAQAFTKFFVAKTPTNAHLKNEEDSNTGDDAKPLAFRPFQVKGDMKLAPVCRKIFTPEEKARLEDFLGCKVSNNNDADDNEEIVRRKPLKKSELYLAELRSGKILPGKWRRLSTDSKDDVILVEDELERVGQEIVEDTPAYIREQMRVKFYKFHDNRRPPYYGTWRKKSTVVKPRKPFAQDKKFFDYEVDSDDEWEEEEPGESLEDGSDDDKDKESEDDDYEVDNEWFVPHGHLSDEELQNEDEFGMGDDNTREAQKAKLQILQQEFAQEMKKKTEKIKPRLIGCIWADINGNQPTECANILWDTLQKKAMILTEPLLLEETEPDRSGEPGSPTSAVNGNNEKPNMDKLKPITLSDNMIKDLTRLVHGNNHSKNFLINEYIAYVEKTEESVKNGDLRKPLKSVIRDKIDEMAEWQAVDATASSVQDMEQQGTEETATESTKKKKKGKKRLCWVVKQEVLDKLDLSLELQNNWEYTLPPKFVKADKEAKPDESTATNENTTFVEESAKAKHPTTAATSQITKFTKVLTPAEKAAKLQNTPASKNATSSEKSSTETKSNTVNNTTSVGSVSKEKKRVPLLMSVGRGQQIPTPAKNKLISQFLQQKSKDNEMKSSSPTIASRSKTVTSPEVEDDDVVILD
ncbi:chromatin assembly factor 1, p180 subunit [Cochliomyia hominivorax]